MFSLLLKDLISDFIFPSKFIKLCPESLKEHTDKSSLRSDETQTFYWSFKYMSNYHLKVWPFLSARQVTDFCPLAVNELYFAFIMIYFRHNIIYFCSKALIIFTCRVGRGAISSVKHIFYSTGKIWRFREVPWACFSNYVTHNKMSTGTRK